MSKYGPIIVLEDDEDDHQIFQEAHQNLGIQNELKLFTSGKTVLEYLSTTKEQPFIIVAEVNLNGMDGLALRRKILADEYLRKKSIPFILLTDRFDNKEVEESYELQVQGFFEKQLTIASLTQTLQKIVDYWMQCTHPNNIN